MIENKINKINVKSNIELSEDSVKINSKSFVIDNTWISFSGTIFKIKEYISNVLKGDRRKFFKDRNYAVCLLVCLDPIEGIIVIEGKQVPYVSINAVPIPKFNALPLVGIVIIQDGTTDLNYGIKPIKNENLILFSSLGNILDKNKEGEKGEDSILLGETGLQGYTGYKGEQGITGYIGITGQKGCTPIGIQGCTGLQGPTGINWDIYIPFDVLI
jgi:hypothetical protein